MPLHVIFHRLRQRHLTRRAFRPGELRRHRLQRKTERIEQLSRPQTRCPIRAGQRENIRIRIAQALGDSFRLILGLCILWCPRQDLNLYGVTH
jgi:hypothetical protein